MEKALKKREAQAVVIEEMRRTGIKRYDKRKENGVKGHLRYDKITDPKICVYQIHSHYVQLYFCQYGLWYYDGRCRF